MSLYVDIKKTFPNFNLSVRLQAEDEVIALLGSSGCGKSLTLKCIAGIETPDTGRIDIDGETVFDSRRRVNIPPQRRRAGFLFQNYALFPTKTVWNNIASVINEDKKSAARITGDMVKLFQLEAVKNLYPQQISGGQQQRAALARLLVCRPKILLLDEPFSALDSHLKWHVEQEIASVLEDFGGTTIFVSHDMREAYRMSEKIAVMEKGEIESVGQKEDVFSSPKTLAQARLTGCKNFSAAEKLTCHLIRAHDWGVDLKTDVPAPDGLKHVAVRARHFQRVSEISGRENVFPCRLHRVIEEPFEKTFEFSFDTNALGAAKLYYAEDAANTPEYKSGEFFIYVPPDKIMCLEG